ncbi:MAG: 1-aminocyclopropane-1-carboxylate deaminase/D-cysteine desulfhydrase [Verrucomicrobiales bacterium]
MPATIKITMRDVHSYFRLDPEKIDRVTLPGCDDLQVFLKREDLIHPFVSGNKWRKLKHNFLEAQRLGKTRMITFGGAYSNHLVAVACASAALGFQSVAFLRGEEAPQNHMLRLCKTFGMELMPVFRNDYRNKEALLQQANLQDAFVIPEGGTNEHAIKGVAEAASGIQIPFDHWIVAVGTGGTLAGLAIGAAAHFPKTQVEGIAVVRAAASLESTVHQLNPALANWKIHHDFAHGGYGRTNSKLDDFCHHFAKSAGILIEPVYTGKMLYAVSQLAKANYFKKGAQILCFHTGGLLGSRVFTDTWS